MRVTQSGQLEIWADEWRAAEIRGQAIVLPWRVSMVLLPIGGRAQRFILWPDSADANGVRKLGIWLKWGSQRKLKWVFLFYLSIAGS